MGCFFYNNKEKDMRSLLAIIFATAFATTAFGDVAGEVSLDFAETASGDWGGTLGVDVDVTAAAGGVALGFEAAEGGDLTLDTWTVDTELSGLGVAVGNDNGVFVGAEGEQTLAAPAMTESIKVTVGDAAVAMGFTDWNSDITDISNIQGSYAIGNVTVAGDYNMDSEAMVLGAEHAGIALGAANVGGAMTYDLDAEKFAFEGVAKTGGITAYLNGDQDDALQNIGGEYAWTLGAADVTAGAAYNFDSEELTPTVGLSFSF